MNRLAEILRNLDTYDRDFHPHYQKLTAEKNNVPVDWIGYPNCLKAIRQIVESGEIQNTYEN